ncbi:hypothetical protein [Oceanobacillus bengalensis]|uniref:Uncharacterized protein n=1 Tax=Oceanobacillus bengalensis TaxID=1435466 RepID=A0A494YSY2_9BACI|nr:hypothetical protein [Oceanobacillus bengalensis]RKQ12981.1 hypothetical protein D8M05_17460 [Oceanobacillus bengalensis]
MALFFLHNYTGLIRQHEEIARQHGKIARQSEKIARQSEKNRASQRGIQALVTGTTFTTAFKKAWFKFFRTKPYFAMN